MNALAFCAIHSCFNCDIGVIVGRFGGGVLKMILMKVIIEKYHSKMKWKMLNGFMKGQGGFARPIHALPLTQLNGCFIEI